MLVLLTACQSVGSRGAAACRRLSVQIVPKGRQKSEPGIMDRLASALSTGDTKTSSKPGSSKPGTWTKRILTQEAEAKRVEKVRAANKVVQ